MKGWIALLAIAGASPSFASIPSSKRYGAWHVVSISSVSGTEGNDASVSLVQDQGCSAEGYGCSSLEVRWYQGGDVVLSIKLDRCRVENDDFYRSIIVRPSDWIENVGRSSDQTRDNFEGWLNAAGKECTYSKVLRKFEMNGFDAAIADFSARLAYWSR